MTPSEAKEFCELNGIHYHEFPPAKKSKDIYGNTFSHNRGRRCSCGVHFNNRYKKPNPTFQHPEEILEVMDKRKDGQLFLDSLSPASLEEKFIHISYITEPDKLAQVALTWCRENKREAGA